MPEDAVHIEGENEGGIQIVVVKSAGNDRFSQELQYYLTHPEQAAVKVKQSKLMLGNIPANRIELIQEGPAPLIMKIYYTFITRGEYQYYLNRGIRIAPESEVPSGRRQLNFYNQILSTFQFLGEE